MFHVRVYPDLNSRHIAQVYSGLYDLEKDRKITLEFSGRFDNRLKNSVRNSVLCIEVSDSETGQTRIVCFDMFDGREISSLERLRLCDVYFKRSYHEEYVRTLDIRDSTKILPYGLNYECRSRNEHDMLKRLLLFHAASKSFSKKPVASLKDLTRELIRSIFLRYGIGSPERRPISIDDFLVEPSAPAERKVLFQTRLWMPEECPRISGDRLKEINTMRVNTVKSLQQRFGNQFVGGLIPTDIAAKNYPELCITKEQTSRRNYIDLVARCMICVTTTGLHDSIGGKFPEYLAASRCIVTEPLKYQLPVALNEGKHYLPFTRPEECVSACERLFSDSQLAERMRRENHQYYQDEVQPSALVYKRLNAAMSH